MPIRRISLSLDHPSIEVTLVYLCQLVGFNECGDLHFLQSVRRSNLSPTHPWRTSYPISLSTYKTQLANLVASEVPNVTAVVSPPSRSNHAKPYREALLGVFHDAKDLTAYFRLISDVHAGDEGTSLEAICSALVYTRNGDEPSISSLVIVDDVFNRGRTATSLVKHLRDAGMPLGASITVAAPLIVGTLPADLSAPPPGATAT